MNNSIWLFVFIFAVIVLVIVIVVLSYRARIKAWGELAQRTGLMLNPGNAFGQGLEVSGTYHGHPLRLDTFVRHHGKSSTSYTRIVLQLASPSPVRLSLGQEGVFSGIGKALGMGDIQTGDDELDRRLVIRGEPEMAVRGVLATISLRQKLLETKPIDIEVMGSEIRYQKTGIEQNPDKLIAYFDLLVAVADAVERQA